MKLIELNKIDRQKIYENHLIKDFPESEVKPLDMIENLIRNNEYMCYGFYDDEKLLGYAFLVQVKQTKSLLLDYLAVCKGSRSNGLGTKFIKILKEKFREEFISLLAEVEDPNFSISEEDKKNRIRRISFYKGNGFEISDVTTRVLTDDYKIIKLKLNEQKKDIEISTSINDIYQTIFGDEFFKKHVSVSV